MRDKRYLVLGLLLLAMVGAVIYGVHMGDALYVFRNASDFCFT
ncbi:MAG TPA: hypothetical protein VM221_01115 [Armatimonadota bacterium]|nr:hypothetical protein [Armatimonadota bacterium]